ncbi:hypothetical protein FB451DRAFT_1051045 [Mycena latifolia]|nr:hypothetical protein FB451DRAFT_1051045 [Mycena latifolia]
MVIRDVRHRWNYTHAMICRGKMLRKAIDSWVLEREELRPLYIKPDEWKTLEDLADILEVRSIFDKHQLSRSSLPDARFLPR